MNAKENPHVETGISPVAYRRAVRRLRAAAVDVDQSRARRQWIRAATRC